jgi:hypothetical protein
MIRWFLIGVVGSGVALGWLLTRWHAAHTSRRDALTIVMR